MSETAIRAEELGKTYDGVSFALRKLSLEIPQGSIFGFLGPNGAGKTTTVKLLTGLLKPTEGSCELLGLSPVKKTSEVHRICGVMTETAKSYGHLTGTQNLIFYGRVSGMNQQESENRAEELLKLLDLWDAREKKLREYSTGMAQRLSLARALVNRPKILFLDEPTSGLDPESSQTVNALILKLARSEGTTVFLCTHQLRYAQDLCESYGILHKGQMLAGGSLEALRREAGVPMRAVFRLREGQVQEGFSRQPDGWWQTEIKSDEEMPKLLKDVVLSGHDVFEARMIRPTLEDVYFKLVERKETLA
ncbi:MAG TPA: ABC transporter ATP-binding protein [Clostridia bacterium]|nr:ABC transporter ATP-binding protein [Clostridia bacterium]